VNSTEEQRKVISVRAGNYLVTAGPGSGKTFSLVQRYTELIKEGVDPRNILAITFTNKAAREMKERATAAVPTVTSGSMQIFTFHGLANYWLRRRGADMGLTNYTLMSTDEVTKTLTSIARSVPLFSHFYETTDDKHGYLVNEYRNHQKLKMKIIERGLNAMESYPGKPIVKICADLNLPLNVAPYATGFLTLASNEYSTYKRDRRKLDFSNLQPFFIHLLEKAPDIAESYHYIIADETQDCNQMNLQLLNKLNRYNNVMAFADHKQSIYGFRGSSSSATQDFISQFNATELFLTRNFRSSRNIVEFANTSIARQEEKMVAVDRKDGILFYKEFDTHEQQLNAVVTKIKLLKGQS